MIEHAVEPAACKTGTEIRVHWPDSACSILTDAEARFLQIADDYTWLNPHLTLAVDWFGEGADGRRDRAGLGEVEAVRPDLAALVRRRALRAPDRRLCGP